MVECVHFSRRRVVPRQPGRRVRRDLLGKRRDGQQIGEGIHAVEPARIDEAHEQVAGLGAKERLVAEAVLAIEDRHFQGLLAAVIIQRRAGLTEERGQSAAPNV